MREDASLSDHRKAQSHVAALRGYLERLSASGELLPRHGGQPNRAAIAAACGMHRQVLYQNPDCAALLGMFDAVERRSQLSAMQRGEAARDAEKKADREQDALRAELLRLRAENAALKDDLARYARIEALMLETGRLP